MDRITFEQLPQAFTELFSKVENIERLLLHKSAASTKPEDELLTIEEASIFLKLAVTTLYGYVQRSEIPVSKGAKRLYFSKKELMEWVKMGRKRTKAEINTDAENYLNSKRK